jgi:hypothetical protein
METKSRVYLVAVELLEQAGFQLRRRRAIAEQVIAAFEPCPLPSMIRSGAR